MSSPNLPRVRARTRTGRCYELAGRGAIEHAGWVLVHGQVRGPAGELIGHAWLKSVDGATVYDAVDDRDFEASKYRSIFAAVELRTWAQKEAAEMLIQQRHWGPWDES